MAFDVEAAKQAGYSQEEIDAFLQGTKEKPLAPVAPGQEVDVTEPPPPTTTVTPAGEGNYMPGLATAGLGLASIAVPTVVGIGIGKYGDRAIDAMKNLVSGAKPPATPTPTPPQIQTLSNVGGGARTPSMQAQMQQMRMAPPAPTAGPMPPSATAGARPIAPPESPSVIQRGMDYARQMQKIAAEKVMQNAGNLAKAGVGIGSLFYSGGLNQGEDEELRRRRAMAPTISR